MKFHPYSEVFDLIEGAAFDDLVADIKAHGLHEKIWLYEGEILDGRNRFLACQRAKVKPQTRVYRGKDPLSFVWSMNDKRRHQTDGQRVLSAAKLATLRDGQKKAGAQICAPSQEEAAQKVGISRRTLQHGRKVVEKGSKALREAVAADEVSISRAASVVDLPKSEQLAAAKQKSEPKPVEVAPAPDLDFTDYEPEDDDEYKKNVENVMMADDKLAAMREELKQIRREMQGLKASRDHYQGEAGAAVRLVKARDREIEKLNKELTKAREKIEALQERVAIMEAA